LLTQRPQGLQRLGVLTGLGRGEGDPEAQGPGHLAPRTGLLGGDELAGQQ
jgi:hypothetical protein